MKGHLDNSSKNIAFCLKFSAKILPFYLDYGDHYIIAK